MAGGEDIQNRIAKP